MESFLCSVVSALSGVDSTTALSPQENYDSSTFGQILPGLQCDTASLQVGSGRLPSEGDQERMIESQEVNVLDIAGSTEEPYLGISCLES